MCEPCSRSDSSTYLCGGAHKRRGGDSRRLGRRRGGRSETAARGAIRGCVRAMVIPRNVTATGWLAQGWEYRAGAREGARVVLCAHSEKEHTPRPPSLGTDGTLGLSAALVPHGKRRSRPNVFSARRRRRACAACENCMAPPSPGRKEKTEEDKEGGRRGRTTTTRKDDEEERRDLRGWRRTNRVARTSARRPRRRRARGRASRMAAPRRGGIPRSRARRPRSRAAQICLPERACATAEHTRPRVRRHNARATRCPPPNTSARETQEQ